jgi:hypothetical protein
MHAQLPAPPTSAVKCGTAAEGTVLSLGGCPGNTPIEAVVFASYGLPKGSCASGFTVNKACAAVNATSIVAKLCVGKVSCKVSATVPEFGGNDPCLGVKKHLSAAIRCAGDPPAGVKSSNVLEAWPCEEQMEKLRLHQAFDIKDGKIHRPPAIGDDLCVQPVQQPAAGGSELTVGDCGNASSVDFSIVGGQIKHVASGLCVALVNDTQGAAVALAGCSTGAETDWSVNTVVNQPTFTSTSDKSLCLDLGSSSGRPAGPVRIPTACTLTRFCARALRTNGIIIALCAAGRCTFVFNLMKRSSR